MNNYFLLEQMVKLQHEAYLEEARRERLYRALKQPEQKSLPVSRKSHSPSRWKSWFYRLVYASNRATRPDTGC